MTNYLDKQVRDLMTSDVAVTTPDAALLDAARLMRERRLSCLVVTCGDVSAGVGVLTHKDIIAILGDEDESEISRILAGMTVSEAMTSPAVALPPYFSVRTCLQQMRMLGVRRAPVVDEGDLVGVISLADVFEEAMASVPEPALSGSSATP